MHRTARWGMRFRDGEELSGDGVRRMKFCISSFSDRKAESILQSICGCRRVTGGHVLLNEKTASRWPGLDTLTTHDAQSNSKFVLTRMESNHEHVNIY